MREYPQFEDLGLDPESDKTPDLRPKRNAPGAAATASEGENNHIHITE